MTPGWLALRKDWTWKTVRELQDDGVLLVQDGNHGEYRPRPDEFTDHGTAFVRAADLSDGSVLFSTAGRINDVALRRIRKGVGMPGDVVFSHKGTVGKLALAPEDAPPFVCSPQTTFWRVTDSARLDRRFLFAYMRASEFQRQWTVRKGDTDMADYVSLTAQRTLLVPLPPLPLQRNIAAIVSAYDELIEDNNRRIEIMEEMAQRIYCEWFVDFRYPGHEDVRLVESTLGPIPREWKVMPLGEAIQLVYGKALKADARHGGHVAVYGSSGVIGLHDEAIADGPGIIIGRKGNVGSVYWADDAFFPIDTTYWVRTLLPLEYVYYAMREMPFLDSHAAVPGLNREQAYSLPLLIPDPRAVDAFAEIVVNAFAVRRCWNAANRVLRETRDLLLPRLLAGQIDTANVDIRTHEIAT